MSAQELLDRLTEIRDRQVGKRSDKEADHIEADGALLEYVQTNNSGVLGSTIVQCFHEIEMWYA